MKQYRTILLLLMLLTGFDVLAKDIRTLEQFVEAIDPSHIELQSIHEMEKRRQYIEGMNVTTSPIEFDGKLIPEYKNEEKEKQANAHLALSKKFSSLGLAIEANASGHRQGDHNSHNWEVGMSKSLSRNFAGSKYDIESNKAKQLIRINELKVLEQYEKFICNAVKEYLDYSSTALELEKLRSQSEKTNKMLRLNNKRYKNGLISKIDVARLRLSLIRIGSDISRINHQLMDSRRTLLSYLPIDNVQIFPDKSSLQARYPESLANILQKESINRSIRISQLQKEELLDRLRLMRLQHRSDWNLTALAQGTKNIQNQQSNLFALELSFSMPLGPDMREESVYKDTISQYKEQEYDEIKKIIQYQLDRQKQWNRIHLIQEQLKGMIKQVKEWQLINAEEEKKYSQGRSGIDGLIESEEELNKAKIELQSLQINLRKEHIQWLELTDQLMSENRTLVKDWVTRF